MWKIAAVAAAALALLVAAVFDLIQPGVPDTNGAMIHPGSAQKCLAKIPDHFHGEYLTLRGHAKAWLYGIADTLDMELDSDERSYLSDYSELHQAVDCHILASGDARLNMTLSASEFQAAYRNLAADEGIEPAL
jgi:hypothetical protein